MNPLAAVTLRHLQSKAMQAPVEIDDVEGARSDEFA